ncbi:tetratricopeptide repeat protein, partial [Streptomyces sp. NPDC059233]
MAASPHSPNSTFRRLRGQHSPAEFAALVRRAAREIGETVSCDARYIGRVESGEIRCPNYAYERVFLHMFPGRALPDLGFSPREAVRGRSAQRDPDPFSTLTSPTPSKESDVLRRAFMAGGSATVAAATLGLTLLGDTRRFPSRAGESEAAAVEDAVRQIRLLDDRHGADALYRRAAEPLRTAYALLDAGATRQSTEDRLQAGAGELAVSVGWLAHDSGRFDDARSHYAEALATARVSGDAGLEAHAFSNMAFLARDCGRSREAVRAAQA